MLNDFSIAFFGSSLVSSYWNGAATYYRGLLKELSRKGIQITFYEPDAWDRQKYRDIDDPPWARVVVYPADRPSVIYQYLDEARRADMLIKASGVGVHDDFLEAEILNIARPQCLTAFWDVDAPATLDRMNRNSDDPLIALIPKYDFVFTYGGGPPVVEAYQRRGARVCVPIYNALDPETHHPVPPDPRFTSYLNFLGNRLPDREERVDRFFLDVARRFPQKSFLLGGNGWHDKELPSNVKTFGHVPTGDHNAFNSSPCKVLNINRESMARYGYSPATRVFEAAGAGACLITDNWRGIEEFLEPGEEVLVASDGDEVADLVQSISESDARAIGDAALRRVLAHHTYAHRACEWVDVVLGRLALAGRVQCG